MCRIKDIPINTLHLEDCASHDNVAMLQELESGMFCMSPCTHVYMWPARSKNLKRSSILFSLALQSLLLPAPQSTGSTCSCTLEQMQLWLLGFFLSRVSNRSPRQWPASQKWLLKGCCWAGVGLEEARLHEHLDHDTRVSLAGSSSSRGAFFVLSKACKVAWLVINHILQNAALLEELQDAVEVAVVVQRRFVACPPVTCPVVLPDTHSHKYEYQPQLSPGRPELPPQLLDQQGPGPHIYKPSNHWLNLLGVASMLHLLLLVAHSGICAQSSERPCQNATLGNGWKWLFLN